MASNIVSNTIDATFPRAGQDNNTQGFRDNFSIIKTGLASAATEITALQDTTAKIDSDNDFNGTTITDANAVLFTQTARGLGTISASQNISLINGHYQFLKIGSTDPLEFTLTGWPERESISNAVAKITVELSGVEELVPDGQGGGTSHLTEIIWKTAFGDGQGVIKKSANWPSTFTIDSVTDAESPVIVEFWSYNQGQTVFANYLGKFE